MSDLFPSTEACSESNLDPWLAVQLVRCQCIVLGDWADFLNIRFAVDRANYRLLESVLGFRRLAVDRASFLPVSMTASSKKFMDCLVCSLQVL